jgi:hypothetical protein
LPFRKKTQIELGMKKMKSKKMKIKSLKGETDEVDPDHFTVYNLKAGWEKEMSDVWSPDDIKQFKQRQETFSKIPSEVRDRTKIDKSYREGWVDVASWILQHNLC